MPNIVSREQAISLGLKRYFSGIPCIYGHVAQRYVCSGACVECQTEKRQRGVYKHRKNERGRERYREDPKFRARHLARGRERYKDDRDRILARCHKYQRENRDRIKERYEKNRDRYRATARKYYEENRSLLNAKSREYHRENRNRIRARKRKYYEENMDHIKAKDNEYYEKNRDAIAARNKQYLAARDPTVKRLVSRLRYKKNPMKALDATKKWAQKQSLLAKAGRILLEHAMIKPVGRSPKVTSLELARWADDGGQNMRRPRELTRKASERTRRISAKLMAQLLKEQDLSVEDFMRRSE